MSVKALSAVFGVVLAVAMVAPVASLSVGATIMDTSDTNGGFVVSTSAATVAFVSTALSPAHGPGTATIAFATSASLKLQASVAAELAYNTTSACIMNPSSSDDSQLLLVFANATMTGLKVYDVANRSLLLEADLEIPNLSCGFAASDGLWLIGGDGGGSLVALVDWKFNIERAVATKITSALLVPESTTVLLNTVFDDSRGISATLYDLETVATLFTVSIPSDVPTTNVGAHGTNFFFANAPNVACPRVVYASAELNPFAARTINCTTPTSPQAVAALPSSSSVLVTTAERTAGGNPTVWEIADITSLSTTTFMSVALPKPIIALSATSAGVFGLSFDAGVVEIIQIIV